MTREQAHEANNAVIAAAKAAAREHGVSMIIGVGAIVGGEPLRAVCGTDYEGELAVALSAQTAGALVQASSGNVAPGEVSKEMSRYFWEWFGYGLEHSKEALDRNCIGSERVGPAESLASAGPTGEREGGGNGSLQPRGGR